MPDRQPGANPNGPPSAQPSEPESPQPPPTPEHSRVVYITDFELDSVAQPPDSNHAASTAPRASDATPPASSSPQTSTSAIQAQHIVKLMSDELAKDFKKSGYTAKFLRPSDIRPDDGFLITGIFAQVGPDSRLRRAVLGSSEGAEPIQLYVAAQDFTRFRAASVPTGPNRRRRNAGEAGASTEPQRRTREIFHRSRPSRIKM